MGQAGAQEIEITPEMIEAGVALLRREFGGQTEGANRFVDFPDLVRRLLLETTRQKIS